METTGLPPDGKVVELGWCDVRQQGDAWTVDKPMTTLVNPGIPIPAIASSIHHLTDEDVRDAPTLADAMAGADLERDDIFAFVAHRASFEKAMLPLVDVRWICSWKVSVTLAPNAPSHSNQALRYFLKLDVNREVASPSHRAGPDAYVTAHLIARALAKMTPEQMVELSAGPIILPKLHFGKHADEPCKDIPSGYWEWALANIKDDNVAHTARFYLNQRQAAQRSRSPV